MNFDLNPADWNKFRSLVLWVKESIEAGDIPTPKYVSEGYQPDQTTRVTYYLSDLWTRSLTEMDNVQEDAADMVFSMLKNLAERAMRQNTLVRPPIDAWIR